MSELPRAILIDIVLALPRHNMILPLILRAALAPRLEGCGPTAASWFETPRSGSSP